MTTHSAKLRDIEVALDTPNVRLSGGKDLYLGGRGAQLAMCLRSAEERETEPDSRKLYYSNAGEKRISKLLVRCVGDEQLIVSSVMVEDNASGQQWKHPVNQVFLSPGSSLRSLSLKPENYSLMEHLRDVVNGYWKLDFYKKMNRQGYRPTIRSVLRHVVNDVETTFGGERIRLEHIGRSALGSMLIIQIDPERAGREKIDQLTKQFCRQANRLVGLRERRVVNEDGKEQVVYLAQVIGNSGEDIDAEIAQANIESNLELCQLLHSRGFDYDVVPVPVFEECDDDLYVGRHCRHSSTFASNVHLQEGDYMMIGAPWPHGKEVFAAQCQSEERFGGSLFKGTVGGTNEQLSKTVKRRLGADDSLSRLEYGTIVGTVAVGVVCVSLLKRSANLSLRQLQQAGRVVRLHPSSYSARPTNPLSKFIRKLM